MDSYRIYDGTDQLGIVGQVAAGLFAQEGRCWRMVYENLEGWTKVWSCERHADELVGARRLAS